MAYEGCRALSPDEQKAIKKHMWHVRDRTLFELQLACGFRITELLSLKWGDVGHKGAIFDVVKVQRKNVKKKVSGRTVPLKKSAREALAEWYAHQAEECKSAVDADQDVFPLTYQKYRRQLKEAMKLAGVNGPKGSLATHCGRKSFAARMRKKLPNIEDVQQALGHKSIASTMHYLKFANDKVQKAILEDDD